MKWRLSREECVPDVPVRREEARQALAESEVTLARTKEQWAEVRGIVHSLRELRKKNHFAEMISRALEERPK